MAENILRLGARIALIVLSPDTSMRLTKFAATAMGAALLALSQGQPLVNSYRHESIKLRYHVEAETTKTLESLNCDCLEKQTREDCHYAKYLQRAADDTDQAVSQLWTVFTRFALFAALVAIFGFLIRLAFPNATAFCHAALDEKRLQTP